MSNYSTTQHGEFVSSGKAESIVINTDIDIIKITNLTEIAATNSGHGTNYDWLKGSNGTVTYHPAADHTLANDVLASGSISVVNTSDSPVVTITSTAALSAGDVVRLFNVTGAQQFGGMDFTIGNNTFSGTTFSLDYAPQIVAATSGSFRAIKYSPVYAPYTRNISKITQASSAVVTFTVDHEYTVGQVIRFNVSAAFGMSEINGKRGTITAVSAANNTITVDIDSSGFTAFAFPLTGAALFTPAHVNPVGETAAENAGLPYQDATRNIAYQAVVLQAGVKKPAGSVNDVIHWEISSTFK